MDPLCTTDGGACRPQDLNILHRFHVAPELLPGTETPPPPPSVGTLELTYFDTFLIFLSPVQRLFLYRLPVGGDSGVSGTSRRDRFLEFHLPRLKRALSHALAVFYPLAGHLVRPNPDAIPVIRYEDGDAVELTVVESQDDFEELAGDAPKASSRFFPLVPDLKASDDTKKPALEVQVTLFPGPGIAVGVTVSHSIADGSSSTHFLKTWAAFCRQLHCDQNVGGGGRDTAAQAASQAVELPIFDRSLVQDPKGLREIYWADIQQYLKGKNYMVFEPTPALQRATFPLSRTDLDLLRSRAAQPPGTRYSSFTLACALTWVCATKAQGNLQDDAQKLFSFAANLRSRIKPPLPAAYFGNCIGFNNVHAKTADLTGDEGLSVAAAAVWEAVQDLHDGGKFVRLGEDACKSLSKEDYSGAISVAGSPSLRVYDVDFGWGRPAKVEVVSCERSGGFSLAETADGCGGVEVGVPLPPGTMPEFRRLWRGVLGSDS